MRHPGELLSRRDAACSLQQLSFAGDPLQRESSESKSEIISLYSIKGSEEPKSMTGYFPSRRL